MARILLLHGLGGTAATMAPLAEQLRATGHTVHAPTLPGHGTDPEALLLVGWSEWLAVASEWPADVVVGQSMGGGLALALAAKQACAGVVAINCPAPDPDAVDGLEWMRERGRDWVDGPSLAEGEIGYDRQPVSALLAMVHGLLAVPLAEIAVPVLLVTSALDEVVDPFSADAIAAVLPGPVHRLVLADSGHVATLGPELPVLAAAIEQFIAAC